jgi:tRNA(fMet)-specific endonuclease VapC
MREPRGIVRRRIEERAGGAAAISIVTLAELRFGAQKVASRRLHAAIDEVIQYLPAIALDAPVDVAYANLRAHLESAGQLIGPNDMWIAAHALVINATLVTANLREFSRVPDLRVENWLD